MKRILLILVLVAFNGACSAFDPFPRDQEKTKVLLAQLIPEGTTVADAEIRLRAKGFRTRIRSDLSRTGIVYLTAAVERPAMPMVKHGWFVRYEVKDDRVYNPFVTLSLTGP